ncbi:MULTISPECIES: glucosyltransferase domain-containing protein [Lacticaseibacillus]|uniref:glucosyltransferase domain-containing protein n=1 Tax=Lacticaseibacillus TaxID=2759736 RepID=UPI00063DBD6E|nr:MULTISPECIES: glucosyltransferase domain-containing protein [Lacticaseibacillus]KLI76805.1 hypothetical protein AAW28_01935 [Lacticaseibacillus casei]
MKKEMNDFIAFFNRRKSAIFLLFVLTIALYIPMLTNFSYSIDSEAIVDNPRDLLFSWLTIDRYGLVILKGFFLYGINLNPYFINILTYFLMAFSAAILLYIIDQTTKVHHWIQTLVVILYIVSPIHFEQNSFVLQSVEVMIGFNLMFIGMITFGLQGKETSIKRQLCAIFLLVASFSIYPSIVIGASTLTIIILHLTELKSPFASFYIYIRHLARYIGAIFSSLVIYVVTDQIIKLLIHAPKNDYIQTAWGHVDTPLLLQIALSKFKQFFILPNQPFNLSMVTLLGLLSLLLILIIGILHRQIHWTLMLDIIFEFILVISLLILLGNMIGPVRSLTPTIPLVIMIYSLTILDLVPNKRAVAVIGLFFSVFALEQFKTTSDLEQSFILTYNDEVKFSDEIITSVQKMGISDFSGYKLVVVGQKMFSSPLTRMGEMIGNTHYNWDLDSPTGSNRRITNFLSSQGYKFTPVKPKDYIKAKKVSAKMGVFPSQKGIQILGKLIIVNLSNR